MNLDLRHLGHAKLRERLPQICDLAHEFLGIDPATVPIPVRPAVHYTMGGIPTNVRAATELPGLYAAGECASSGIHGANRLGSNSLAELCVFGRVAGEDAARFAKQAGPVSEDSLARQAEDSAQRAAQLLAQRGGAEKLAEIRNAMAQSMERGCGIYRTAEELDRACAELAALKTRAQYIALTDRSPAWNTEWLGAIELGFQLDVAQAMAHSAYARHESRGAHQRLDAGCTARDDAAFLKHTLAWRAEGGPPRIDWSDVVITKSPPGKRAYGGEAEALERASKEPVNA